MTGHASKPIREPADGLMAWLAEHPAPWAGWPTSVLWHEGDSALQRERLAGLRPLLGNFVPAWYDDRRAYERITRAIAEVRTRRRQHYCASHGFK